MVKMVIVESRPGITGRYCCTIAGLLKIVLIIFASVVLGLVCYENVEAGGYGHSALDASGAEIFTIVIASCTIAISAVLLIVFFFRLHHEGAFMNSWGCANLVFITYLILGIGWLCAGGIETWVAVKWRGEQGRNHLYERRCAAAAFSFACGLISLYKVHLVRWGGYP